MSEVLEGGRTITLNIVLSNCKNYYDKVETLSSILEYMLQRRVPIQRLNSSSNEKNKGLTVARL